MEKFRKTFVVLTLKTIATLVVLLQMFYGITFGANFVTNTGNIFVGILISLQTALVTALALISVWSMGTEK